MSHDMVMPLIVGQEWRRRISRMQWLLNAVLAVECLSMPFFAAGAVAGMVWYGGRREREHATHATPRVMESILRNPSLGPRPFPEHEGDNRWSVVLAIPPQALFMHSLTDWSGLKAKVNLYKCGDKLSQPHFLSWKPIAAPKPDFHLPEFFEQIKFSKI